MPANATKVNINGTKYVQVDQESDSGLSGSSLDLEPYANDLPENLEAGSSLHPSASEFNFVKMIDKSGHQLGSERQSEDNGSTISNYSGSVKFQPGPHQIYCVIKSTEVSPWDIPGGPQHADFQLD